ncbi:ribonuclease P protein component [Streptococcus cuniculipharyngis]|uniref:Ribonuclease P protein component n=1 Tax=Streptococcus cuniculipharyngis TaxID=1562651 RepID=A0A5C5SCY3_9STRE|nr:ribonuclease P protein component [Streptococcus cuniculipharyngis]TWS97659.1 ribonuclease P protein component [Streptococcus cuniculipharyngis]
MRKSYRVKTERDFEMIFRQGTSLANRKFVVYFLEKEQPHFRVGLSVSKKLGNAVVRNAIKRQLRHLLQDFSAHLRPYDFVVIARKGVEELTHQEIRQNLLHVLKLAKLYQEGLEDETESKA